MKFFSKEVKIAFTAIIAIIFAYVGIVLLKGLDLFNNSNEYTVVMKDVTGITISSEVKVNGLKVGYVKDIRYNEAAQNMHLLLSIDPAFKVPTGTTAFVSKEMLGASMLNLDLGPATAPAMNAGDTIYGVAATDLMSAAVDMLPQVKALLPKIDSILTSLNQLTSDPALAASLHNIERTTANLNATTARLDHMMQGDVPQLMASAKGAMQNAEQLTATLNRVDIEGIASQANQTMSNVNQATQKLNHALHSRDNSLGLLLNDNSLALHLDSTVVNASMLLEDLRLHPKRYVHFSVFGKKEK